MYKVEVEKTLQGFMDIFYRIGIWQIDEESASRKTGKKLFYAFFFALLPIFYATNAILCDDRNESIFSVQLTIQTSVLYVKCLYLLFKKKEILAFVYDRIVQSTENDEDYEQTEKKMKRFVKFVRPYSRAIYLTCFLIIFMPMFSTDKMLPTFVSFSWSNSEIAYWVAYLLLALSVVVGSVDNLLVILIWYIMLKYSIEYQELGNKLRNLGRKTIKTRAKNQKNVESGPRSMYVKDLIDLIKTHQKLAETVERFKSCFAPLFFGQITTSGIAICVSLYNLAFASKQNIIQTEMFAVILLYALFDIFLVMYLANEITVASDRLSSCLFESNWIEQTESCKTYVLIMGEVLKQPQQLVILIYPMNLETFTSIINGGYSMFNIMKKFQ